MPSQSLDSFLTSMAGIASGALQGRSQAVRENADQEQEQRNATQKLLVEQLKLKAEQEKEIRDRAFTYAGKLQDVITSDNLGSLKYLQDNGLLPQMHREIQGAMDVASSRVSPHAWQPQFGFSDSAAPQAGGTTAGGLLPAGTTTPPPGPTGAPAGVRPSPADALARAGGMIPRLTGLATPTASTAPPPLEMIPAAPPAPAPRAFPLTEAQTQTRLTQAETERSGRARDLLAAKKFNLDVANAQIDKTMALAEFRRDTGQKAFDSSFKEWDAGLKAAIDVLKAGGSTDDVGGVLLKLLSVPNGLGRMPNANAIILGFTKKGVDPQTILQVLTDPGMAAAGVPPITLDQVERIAAGEKVDLGPALPQANPSPGAAPPPGGAKTTSRGAGGRATVPVLPATQPGLGLPATPEQVNQGLRERSQPFRGTAPVKLQGNASAIRAIDRMDPAARQAAMTGFNALAVAGVPFTVNSTYRTPQQQRALLRAKAAGRNPNPVAPEGTSTHQAGLGLDLTSGTGRQQDLAAVLEPLGWKWAGPADPPHFTYVGTRPAAGSRNATVASRGAAGAAAGGTTTPPAAADAARTGKEAGLTPAATEVGVKTPATAAPIANPYPPGTLGAGIFDKLSTGQRTPLELIHAYSHDPGVQNLVQEIAEQIKRQQAGNLFGNAPTPSLEGARLPTQAGIDSLANLEYQGPAVGRANVTTEPVESAPNAARPVTVVRDLPPATGKEPPPGGKKEPGTKGPGTKGPAASPRPLATAPLVRVPSTKRAAPGGPSVLAAPAGRPTGGPGLLTVPPPPSQGPTPTTPAEARSEWKPSLLTVQPPSEGPKIMDPGRGPVIPSSITPAEARSERAAMQPYLKSPYRAPIDRWLNQNGLNDLRDRRFYYAFIHEKFVPGLIRQGITPRELVKNLDHYLRAHQHFRTGPPPPRGGGGPRVLTVPPPSEGPKIMDPGRGPVIPSPVSPAPVR